MDDGGRRLPILLVGAACRLPGAADETAFRSLLDEGRCAVRPFPTGRWNPARLLHPATTEPGFSYSFAGGYLDDPWGFDPTVFALSPREAAQMDPQQRLLLEVVREALEDARLPPSEIAGEEVGVYVGASSLDHGNLHAADPASIDAHFMTGNTLSVIANRVSHAFDLRGPSFTVDTACSSSLVACAQAFGDLVRGRVDTAIVAGVNILLSPASFIGFSRASMLSPTGLCRPFSSAGDGYVRGEGAVAFVLRRADVARPGSARAEILAAEVNSDGHTSGIALPGLDGQIALLERIYGDLGLAPDDVDFVEAHGTGTRVGDPIEATALGRVLGRGRSRPLPIGSVKSNIGHLEPASGVAGLMKALIALETRRLPATLHLDDLNPLVDFAELNLAPARTEVALDPDVDRPIAGVSSFGFGGTNAHVVVRARSAESPAPGGVTPLPLPDPGADLVLVSAATRESLRAAAAAHAALLAEGVAPRRLATALLHDRDRMKHRLVVAVDEDPAAALAEYGTTGRTARGEEGIASGRDATVCFVYSGNGAQWLGMGRAAHARNAAFRKRFEEIDAAFAQIAGRSLVADLMREEEDERTRSGLFVQPLFFAIQVATTAGLAAAGLVPRVVLGHSLGEIAAAVAAGAIGIEDALRAVSVRSTRQEAVRGLGTMAVFAASRDAVAELVADVGADDLEVVAENGPGSVTISGSIEAVGRATALGRRRRMASRTLDVDYPYHTPFLEPLRGAVLADLADLRPRQTRTPLVSTVTGAVIEGGALDGEHWWRNMREPVRFRRAVETAADLGADLFVEIGPRPILAKPVADTLDEAEVDARVIASLSEADDRDGRGDPILRTVARAVAHGARLTRRGATPPVDRSLRLPTYRWHRLDLRFPRTSERLDVFGDGPRHPLIGGRLAEGQPEWRTLLDARVVPYLADHVVEGEIVVPGAAFAEMMLAVARDLRPSGPIGFEDLDILTPLVLPRDAMREISVRHGGLGGFVEVWSRPRLGPDEWSLHARGRILPQAGRGRPPVTVGGDVRRHGADEVYARAAAAGLAYGPGFRLVRSVERTATTMAVRLASPDRAGTGRFDWPQLLHPASLDAALHGLFCVIRDERDGRRTHLPVRIARLVLHRDHVEIASARLRLDRERDDSVTVSVWLLDAGDRVVAEADGMLLRAVDLGHEETDDVLFHVEMRALERDRPLDAIGAIAEIVADPAPADEARLMLRAHMRAAAHRAFAALAGDDGRFDLPTLVGDGRLAAGAVPLAAMLVDDLVGAGLAEPAEPGVRLSADTGLPPPEPILSTFAAEFPEASAELVLAARAARDLPTFLATGEPVTHTNALLDQFDAAGRFGDAMRRRIGDLLDRLSTAAGEAPPRVLLGEPDCRALLAEMLPRLRRRELRLTIAGVDATRLDQCAARLPGGFDVGVLDLGETTAARPAYDLAIVHAFRHAGDDGLVAGLTAHLIDGGTVVAACPAADPLFDFHFGAGADWFAGSLDPLTPIGPIPTVAETRRRLTSGGIVDIGEWPLDGDGGVLLAGRRPARPAAETPAPIVDVAGSEPYGSAVETAFADAVRAAGGRVLAAGDVRPEGSVETVRFVAHGRDDDVARVGDAVRMLRETLAAAGGGAPRSRVTVVVGGGSGTALDPVGAAVADLVRVAANETPDVEFRLVDLDPSLDPATAAARLLARLRADDDEREVRIGADGVRVPRVSAGLPFAPTALVEPEAMELRFPRRGAIERFFWRPKQRRAPGAGEIEVEVSATGLNFRDVMLSLGLLDDDVLDDGLAGAVHGIECVGRVTAVGDGVAGRALGDVVFGFAANAFGTHVTAAADGFAGLPPGLSAEAAASVPVAFVTAWYGLVERARLQPGERVLIHGAAGGVGLAAIQIARARGAHVVATVSTPDKRALVELFGADVVLDSRSLDFADTIRDELGGVDVVLNSLSGDAMRASVKCLKPFGRFVELGKRDYVGNTELALRPFRRNLSYFGVDLDQLLRHAPEVVARGLDELVGEFAAGTLVALPIRIFGAAEVADAFRTMQAAGHVGKILVRPPALAGIRRAPQITTGRTPAEGVQLVVGGTGGFGFATARRLAEKGSKKIVVASRGGRLDPAAEAEVARLRQAGCDFRVECCDATDRAAVDALVAATVATMGPITGVWHTAMVLDDGFLAGLDDDRVARVLAPKIAGADNLDRATRGQPIETFVLFSSAATLVGNPGQAAYVAANGWLHGLARRRRAEGLPALAVAWGAIADVGALAADAVTAGRLEKVTGAAGLGSREALARLDEVAAQAERLGDPVVWCARFRLGAAARDLPILRTPLFEGLLDRSAGDDGVAETDLAALVAGKSEAEAQKFVGGIVAAEVARILRVSAAEVDLGRPLDELGLDSLMALELRMNVETRYGVELPLVAITSVANLHDLSRRMLREIRSGDTPVETTLDTVDRALIAAHGGDESAFVGRDADDGEADPTDTEGTT